MSPLYEQLWAYQHHRYAWITVILPAILSLAALVSYRRTALRPDAIDAVLSSIVISFATCWWTPAGLQILPFMAVAMIGVRVRDEARAKSIATAWRYTIVAAAWTWFVTLWVDLTGCMLHEQCRLADTGAAGWSDGLVLSPVLAGILIWGLYAMELVSEWRSRRSTLAFA